MTYPAIQTGLKTDPGRQRDHNEDSLAQPPLLPPETLAAKGRLWVVADGMGGHQAGEVASRLAVQSIQSVYYGSNNGHLSDALLQAVQSANRTIYQQAQTPAQRGMGSTVVAALVHRRRLLVAHIGDSRAYLFRNHRLTRLTEDDTWVTAQLKAGTLTPQEAAHHEQRHLLTRSLGRNPDVTVSLAEHTFQPGDCFLLCSDGLTAALADSEIEAILADWPPQPAADRLVAEVNRRGGPDNVTVIIGHWPRRSPLAALAVLRPGLRSPLPLILLAIGLALVLFGTLWGIYHYFLTDEPPYEPAHSIPTPINPPPALLVSGRLEQLVHQAGDWQLEISNTGGTYQVHCRAAAGAVVQDRRPLLKNLVVVYGRRLPDSPQEIEAYFVDAEALPYNGASWQWWCVRPDLPLNRTVWLQTSLTRYPVFYLRDGRTGQSLPALPLSPSLLVSGRWAKIGEGYFFRTGLDALRHLDAKPFPLPPAGQP